MSAGGARTLTCLFLFCPAPAYAGAWTEAPGHGQTIITFRGSSAVAAFDAEGETRAADFRKQGVELYASRGVTGNATVILQTSYAKLRSGGQSIAGWEDTQVGVQQRLLHDERQVLSVLVSSFIPGDPALTSGGFDSEMRVLYGRSFTLGGRPAYVNVETGYRWRANGFADQVRPDITLGWNATPSLALMAQSFNAIVVGDGATDYEGEQNKAQLSAVWSVSQAARLQVGAFATLAGANSPRERGLLASLWLNF